MAQPPRAAHPRRHSIVTVLALIQFMLMLDDTVVNVALPTIQRDLGYSLSTLSWVVNGYFLLFGGFLLLGGRAADLFGRRRVFVIGVAVFAAASLVAGLSADRGLLIAARAAQGLGAALASPAALSLVVTLFTEPRERARVLGLWASLNMLGGTTGVILSGAVVDTVSWRWLFFINLPIAGIALVLLPALYRWPEPARGQELDLAGAVTITGSLTLLVYTLLGVPVHGWGAFRTLAGLIGAASLALLFLLVEHRHPQPLVRLAFFAHRRRAVAFTAQLIVGSAVFGSFFLLSLYMQQILGFSALRAGFAYLTVFGATVPALVLTSRLVPRIGVRPVLVMGLCFVTAGLFLLSRAPTDATFAVDVLPGMALLGYGLGHCFISLMLTAVSEVPPQDAGLVSGTLTACLQVGGAVGLSLLVTAAAGRARTQEAAGVAELDARLAGIHLAFFIAAVTAAVALAVVAAFVGRLIPQGRPGGPPPGTSGRPAVTTP